MTQMPALLMASCMLLLLLLLLVMFYCCIACKCVDFSDETSVMPEVPVHTNAQYSEVCDVNVCEMGELTDVEAPTVIVDSPVPSPAGTFIVSGDGGNGSGGSGSYGSNRGSGHVSAPSTAYPVERNMPISL